LVARKPGSRYALLRPTAVSVEPGSATSLRTRRLVSRLYLTVVPCTSESAQTKSSAEGCLKTEIFAPDTSYKRAGSVGTGFHHCPDAPDPALLFTSSAERHPVRPYGHRTPKHRTSPHSSNICGP
jgi:hypothetical protein